MALSTSTHPPHCICACSVIVFFMPCAWIPFFLFLAHTVSLSSLVLNAPALPPMPLVHTALKSLPTDITPIICSPLQVRHWSCSTHDTLHVHSITSPISCQLLATRLTSGNLITIFILHVICICIPLCLHQHTTQFSTWSSTFWNSKAQYKARFKWAMDCGCLIRFLSPRVSPLTTHDVEYL